MYLLLSSFCPPPCSISPPLPLLVHWPSEPGPALGFFPATVACLGGRSGEGMATLTPGPTACRHWYLKKLKTLLPGLGLGLIGAFVLAGALGTTLGGALVVAPGWKRSADNSNTTTTQSSPRVNVSGSKQKQTKWGNYLYLTCFITVSWPSCWGFWFLWRRGHWREDEIFIYHSTRSLCDVCVHVYILFSTAHTDLACHHHPEHRPN